MELFKVGGCVRDEFLGLKIKDVDFAVDMSDEFGPEFVALDIFDVMRARFISQGFEEFKADPETFTTRCKVPVGHPLREETDVADFVMCRKEGPYSDGRHPDWVKMGTLMDDLARRDFTMNAIAVSTDGTVIDPFNGVADIEAGIIDFVGDSFDRIREDGLRVLRAIRFAVTKNMRFSQETHNALMSTHASAAIRRPKVNDNRKRDELEKAMVIDTFKTINLLTEFDLLGSVFNDQLRFTPTTKKRFIHEQL